MINMVAIDKNEVLKLSQLARIDLTEPEANALVGEISDILDYVKVVQDIDTDDDALPPPPHRNILRDDAVTNQPGAYTEALLEAAPDRHGQFVKVKKILTD